MEWDTLFADLESRFEAERRAGLAAESAELAEADAATVVLADRLRARAGQPVRLRTRAGHQVDGVLRQARSRFLLVDEESGVRALVPVEAVATASPLGGVATPSGEVERRTGVGTVLRALARQGARVRLVLATGEVVGRLVRVGADHVDVVQDGARGAVGRVSVSLGAVEVIRSR